MGQNPPSTVVYMCHAFILKFFVFWQFALFFFVFSQFWHEDIDGFFSKSNRLGAEYGATSGPNLNQIGPIFFQKNHFEEKFAQGHSGLVLGLTGKIPKWVFSLSFKHIMKVKFLKNLHQLPRLRKPLKMTYYVIVTSYNVILQK